MRDDTTEGYLAWAFSKVGDVCRQEGECIIIKAEIDVSGPRSAINICIDIAILIIFRSPDDICHSNEVPSVERKSLGSCQSMV